MSDFDRHPELDMSDWPEDQIASTLEYMGKVSLLERMDELARLAQAAREHHLHTESDFQLYVGLRMMDLAVKYLKNNQGGE